MPGMAVVVIGSQSVLLPFRPSPRRVPTSHAKPTTCECGQPIRVFFNRVRNPHARPLRKRNVGVIRKDHDLCQRCFRQLLTYENAKGEPPCNGSPSSSMS